MHTTMAFSGGCMYSPTTSRTFASSSGSVENLNVSIRQGCRFQSCQILATVAKRIPSSLPSSRLDQCVTPNVAGGLVNVATTTCSAATGADLLWRVRTDRGGPTPIHLQDLPDGSWLARLQQTHSAAARAAEPMLVRVVDYTIDDGRDNPTTYRLFTTLPTPSRRPRSSWPRPTPNGGRSS